MVEIFSRWPEVVPMVEIKTEDIIQEIYNCWIAQFGVSSYITSDQAHQFESGSTMILRVPI